MIGRILPITASRALLASSCNGQLVGNVRVLPAILVVGGSFAGHAMVLGELHDSNLVDIAAGVVSR